MFERRSSCLPSTPLSPHQSSLSTAPPAFSAVCAPSPRSQSYFTYWPPLPTCESYSFEQGTMYYHQHQPTSLASRPDLPSQIPRTYSSPSSSSSPSPLLSPSLMPSPICQPASAHSQPPRTDPIFHLPLYSHPSEQDLDRGSRSWFKPAPVAEEDPKNSVVDRETAKKLHTISTDQLCLNLAHRALQLLDKANQLRSPNDNTPARIIIAISGTPGSGKSTLANKVTALLNESTPNIHNPRATVVPMDGFHLTRGQLDQFPDPVLAHRRRGAAFTFDAAGVVNMVKTLHESAKPQNPAVNSDIQPTTIPTITSPIEKPTTTTTTTTTTIASSSSPSSPSSPSSSSLHNRPTLLFPSFDHALKDPVADGIKVSPDTSIIILEGLYLHLDQSPWNTIPGLVDDKWFIDIDDSLARTRVAKRHLQCGIVDKLDEGYRRYDDNDRLNAAEVVDHRVDANVCITSLDNDRFVCQGC